MAAALEASEDRKGRAIRAISRIVRPFGRCFIARRPLPRGFVKGSLSFPVVGEEKMGGTVLKKVEGGGGSLSAERRRRRPGAIRLMTPLAGSPAPSST